MCLGPATATIASSMGAAASAGTAMIPVAAATASTVAGAAALSAGPAFMTWGGLGGAAGSAIGAAGQGIGATAASGFFGSAFNFFTSPGFSLFSRVVGFGLSAAGQQSQLDSFGQQIAFREAILANNRIIADQEIAREQQEMQRIRQLIGEQGQQAISDSKVDAIGRGLLANTGSPADKTEELAGDIALAKANADRNSQLRIHQLEITKTNFQTDAGLLAFQLQQARSATKLNIASSALDTASSLSRRFRFDKGGLAFRT